MRLIAIAAVLLATTPAFADDAVTYRGTLGTHDIVVELTDPDVGTMVGRYSYMAKGGDIPLDTLEDADGTIRLSEEAPCTETTCVSDDSGNISDKPAGALWTLSPPVDGKLTGTWKAKGKAGKALDITLTEIGRRVLPEGTEVSPYGLYTSAAELVFATPDGFTSGTAPYEIAKMDVAMDEGPVETIDGSEYRYVTDPRSKFAFPRVVSLVDGSSPDAANAALAARHAAINYAAFDCLAQVYGGFGGRGDMLGMGAGTLADFDSESIMLTYLSPAVTGWTEGGSTFCQGAYPNNHFDSYTLDTQTGSPLPLGKVFKDWIATANYVDDAPIDQDVALQSPDDYGWQAGQPLIDYVIANRTVSDDVSYESECGINDLIASYLGVRFVEGDKAIFSLVGLPHVSFACGDDLVTVDLADIPELLTPTAKDYFPSLAQ